MLYQDPFDLYRRQSSPKTYTFHYSKHQYILARSSWTTCLVGTERTATGPLYKSGFWKVYIAFVDSLEMHQEHWFEDKMQRSVGIFFYSVLYISLPLYSTHSVSWCPCLREPFTKLCTDQMVQFSTSYSSTEVFDIDLIIKRNFDMRNAWGIGSKLRSRKREESYLINMFISRN